MCDGGAITEVPDCNGSKFAEANTTNPAITSPKAGGMCYCSSRTLTEATKKCYTDPKGASTPIDDCTNISALNEPCICGTVDKIAQKYDFCDSGTIKKGCLNEDDKCTKTVDGS